MSSTKLFINLYQERKSEAKMVSTNWNMEEALQNYEHFSKELDFIASAEIEITHGRFGGVRPGFVTKDNQYQFIVYHPPGQTMYDGQQLNNSYLAKILIERLTNRESIAFCSLSGWSIYQSIDGKFVKICGDD